MSSSMLKTLSPYLNLEGLKEIVFHDTRIRKRMNELDRIAAEHRNATIEKASAWHQYDGRTLEEVQREHIQKAIFFFNGDLAKAASALGITSDTSVSIVKDLHMRAA